MRAPTHSLARLALLVALAAATSGCTAKGEAESGEDEGGGGPPPATVQLGAIRSGTLTVDHRLLGEVRSKAHAELAAGESGEVREVTVREGDVVDGGKLLVEIDPSLVRARIAAAAAQLRQAQRSHEQAERDAERMKEAGPDAVAASEIEQAETREAELEARKAELSALIGEQRARLSRHRVVAPFAGQVVARSVDPGDWVSPGDPVVELVAVDQLEVLVEAPPELADDLEVGDEAILRRGEGRHVGARIEGLVRAVSPATRTIKLRLVPDETPRWLLPGGPVDAVFRITHGAEDALVVPRDALVTGAVGKRVVRAVDGKATPVEVEVLVASESEAIVEGEGLEVGQQVVVRGNERLRPGQPLKIVEAGDEG